VIACALLLLTARLSSATQLWSVEEVTPGTFVSVKLDSHDRPGIVALSGSITYASKASGTWSVETVANPPSEYFYLSDPTLVFDAFDVPHVCFTGDGYTEEYTYPFLGYRERIGGAWRGTTIDAGGELWGFFHGSSIALDSAGTIAVSYWGDGYQSNGLTYARKIGTAWSAYWSYRSFSGWFGNYTSLAHDPSGNAYIASSMQTPQGWRIVCVSGQGIAWTTEIVDPALVASQNSRPSIAVDRSGNPHLSYGSVSGVKYARKSNGQWIVEIADNAGSAPTAITVDHAGEPRIAYNWQDGTLVTVKYASREAGVWHVSVVDTVVSLRSASVASDRAGKPHIAFGRGTDPIHYAQIKLAAVREVEPRLTAFMAGDVVVLEPPAVLPSGGVRIRFSLPEAAVIALRVYDPAGRHIADPGAGFYPQGRSDVMWSGADRAGRPVGAGVYLIRLTTPSGARSAKIYLPR
jgi:ribosomal protein L14